MQRHTRIRPVFPAFSLALVVALSAGSALAKSPAKPSRPPSAPAAAADTDADVQKPCKRLIGAIRYKKDAMALAQLDGAAQTRFLLADHHTKATEAERKEFGELFHKMFAAIAFPRVRGDFEKLDSVLYDKPTVRGSSATMGSTITILHPMKKQEIRATYTLAKSGDAWRVVDVQVKGDKSMLTNIRDDQVQVIIKKGGMARLLELMRKRVASLK